MARVNYVPHRNHMQTDYLLVELDWGGGRRAGGSVIEKWDRERKGEDGIKFYF